MAGFGAALFAAAGAMQGVGAQIVEDAKAKREERMKQLDREFQLKRDDVRFARDVELKKMDQTFQGGEAQKSRDFQGGENALNRSQQSSENQKSRDAQRDLEDAREKARAAENERDRALKGEYGTGSDGKTMFLQGGQAKPVTGPDGQPVGSVTRFNSGTVTSPSEKRLRYEAGLKAGASDVGRPHNWSATVAEWRALDVDVQDPRIVERVRQDLESQAGKKGMRGDAAVKWINGEMMRLGVGVNSSTENLKTPGPTAPTKLPSTEDGSSGEPKKGWFDWVTGSREPAPPPAPAAGNGFGAAIRGSAPPPAASGGGSSAAMRGAPGQTVATPSPTSAEGADRIEGAFSQFSAGGAQASPRGDKQTGKGQPPGEYPDAQWSDAAGGWVVQRNGKWFRVKG